MIKAYAKPEIGAKARYRPYVYTTYSLEWRRIPAGKRFYCGYKNYKANKKGIKTHAYNTACSCGQILRQCLTFDPAKDEVYVALHKEVRS